jgi:hypothetical protein
LLPPHEQRHQAEGSQAQGVEKGAVHVVKGLKDVC